MPFSERMGFARGREEIQLNSMDTSLRTAIYNLLHDNIGNRWRSQSPSGRGCGHVAARHIWTDFLQYPADEFPSVWSNFCAVLKKFVLEGQWNYVYDLLQFVESDTQLGLNIDALNRVFEREMSGYRFREGMIVPVSDSVELSAIDDALNVPERLSGARAHLIDALSKLSQKPEPDVRNAITEAVSAVESAARIVTGKPKATLEDALRALEASGYVHAALKQAWTKLYAYTSDEQGLRHAMISDPDIDFPTAKYMVVSCAAFVNLLSARV